MLFWFYNIAYVIFFTLGCPYFLWRISRRGNMWMAFGERFAKYEDFVLKKIRTLNRPIWIHAVSVGEMMIAGVLVREIRKLKPDQDIILTTTTQTGRRIGQSLTDERTVLVYHPIDFYFVIRKAFKIFNPSLLVLVEGEIWPNHLWQAKKRRIPAILVNARLSERSFARYLKWTWLARPILKELQWIGIQHDSDVTRFSQAGFQTHKLFDLGSIKFDVAELSGFNADLVPQLREALGWSPDDPVILGGSTHHGEEHILLATFKLLKREHPRLKLVLVPRHAERTPSVLAECAAMDVPVILRSQITLGNPAPDVLLVDTTGELRSLYPLGNIVFIGKSLKGHGGQNFIEAVRHGSVVITGPHMSNFSTLVEIFKENNAIVQVADEKELAQEFRALLANPIRRDALSRRALQVFQQHLGATSKTAAMILGSNSSI